MLHAINASLFLFLALYSALNLSHGFRRDTLVGSSLKDTSDTEEEKCGVLMVSGNVNHSVIYRLLLNS